MTPVSELRYPPLNTCSTKAQPSSCSHLGRPKGGPDPKYSMKPVGESQSTLMKKPVAFAEDCVGPEAEAAAKALKPGEILLLENLRFHPEEEKNDLDLAKKMASLAEIFINDTAFSLPTARTHPRKA